MSLNDLHPGTRSVLNHHTLPRFEGETLFHRLARTLCEAECLPRKELYEAWEVARRVRRRARGAPVYDLAAGHGLLGWVMLLLDDTSPYAVCVDRAFPPCAAKIAAVLTARWPRLEGRVRYEVGDLRQLEITPPATVVSAHACGVLTDHVLSAAIAAGADVGVLPCCHALKRCDLGGVDGWVDGPLAVDLTRAARLRAAGYEVFTQSIPVEITPKNRLLIGRRVR